MLQDHMLVFKFFTVIYLLNSFLFYSSMWPVIYRSHTFTFFSLFITCMQWFTGSYPPSEHHTIVSSGNFASKRTMKVCMLFLWALNNLQGEFKLLMQIVYQTCISFSTTVYECKLDKTVHHWRQPISISKQTDIWVKFSGRATHFLSLLFPI